MSEDEHALPFIGVPGMAYIYPVKGKRSKNHTLESTSGIWGAISKTL